MHPVTHERADVVIIGAGIAGASVASVLAERLGVVLLERETFPGMHSTGRSAALFSEIYGSAPIRALSRASRRFLYSPPPGFADTAIVRPRDVVHIASAEQLSALDQFCALKDVAPAVRRVSGLEAQGLCPILRSDYVTAAALEESAADVDVNALHQGYLRRLKSLGGQVVLDAEVTSISRNAGCWVVAFGERHIEANVVVNAAGAWSDELAQIAGVAMVGLQPMRRTALIVDGVQDIESGTWPMVIDIDEQFYFRPDAGGLLISPADETPSAPCDAQPEEWDIALAIDRVQTATSLQIRRVRRSWAGLRSFTPDRTPVVGYAPDAPGFFWLAGQGGYGIQTAPAMARLSAALIQGEPIPAELSDLGVDAEPLRLGRFCPR